MLFCRIKTKPLKPIDNSQATEDKIKHAAHLLFMKKGFAATTTRDIAEEAGINLALLNYYFRSKQKLFELIMQQTISQFFQSMMQVFHDPISSLDQKVERIADAYIDLLISQPELPLFIFSELRSHPAEFVQRIGMDKVLLNSIFMQQLQVRLHEHGKAKEQPLHYFINLLGLTVFPFITKPLVSHIGQLKQQQFNALMTERKKKIPVWFKSILEN